MLSLSYKSHRRGNSRLMKSRGDTLGKGDDICRHPEVLVTKVFAGAPEARLNFVHHQQNPVSVRTLTQSSEEPGISGDISAFTQYRFHNKRCDLARRRDRGEQKIGRAHV